MSAGTRCDGPGCPAFGPSPAPGWFYLGQSPAEEEPPSFAAALFGNRTEPLTFCTVKCLADWAYVQKLAVEAAGAEPQP